MDGWQRYTNSTTRRQNRKLMKKKRETHTHARKKTENQRNETKANYLKFLQHVWFCEYTHKKYGCSCFVRFIHTVQNSGNYATLCGSIGCFRLCPFFQTMHVSKHCFDSRQKKSLKKKTSENNYTRNQYKYWYSTLETIQK